MKRIGILTYHFSNHNFGALLQTYASVVVLRKMGLDPTVIHLTARDTQQSTTNILSSIIAENPFDKFRKEFIPLTELIENEKALRALNDRFDAFYVGSDQVWRQEFAKENILHYFLDFVSEDKLKVSYAASFGKESTDFDAITKQTATALIKRFNAISVRESSGVTICKNEFGVDSIQVLDPTLLLTESDYSAVYKSYKCQLNSNYIAYYELGFSIGISEKLKPFQDYYQLPVENIYRRRVNLAFKTFTPFSSVGRWLQMLRSSELVITNSYHCVIFSIIFKKDFIVLASEFGGNTRVISLLEDLGLSDRFFEQYEKERLAKLQAIDYVLIDERLTMLREKSYNFLKVLN